MIDIAAQLPILPIVLPLVAAPLCVLLGNRHITYLFSLVVCWLTFAGSIGLLIQVSQTGTISYEIGGWAPPYGIVYIVDYLSGFVMLFVSGLAAIVLTYAPSSINREIPFSKHYLFHACYLLCIT